MTDVSVTSLREMLDGADGVTPLTGKPREQVLLAIEELERKEMGLTAHSLSLQGPVFRCVLDDLKEVLTPEKSFGQMRYVTYETAKCTFDMLFEMYYNKRITPKQEVKKDD